MGNYKQFDVSTSNFFVSQSVKIDKNERRAADQQRSPRRHHNTTSSSNTEICNNVWLAVGVDAGEDQTRRRR